MNKEVLQPLSGFRDYSGPTKDWLIAGLRKIFLKYGYQPLETPAIERQELLLKDYGEEAQKLLYLFEDNGKRKVGLRYDLTLPLARFYAANYQLLPSPYKRFEIGPVWRAERAQKGRLRQFTQADVDIVGAPGVDSEEELLRIIGAAQELIGIKFKVMLNDRNIIGKLLTDLKINDIPTRRKIVQVLDKQDKISMEDIEDSLSKLSITDVQLRSIKGCFFQADNLDDLEGIIGKIVTADLKKVISCAKNIGLVAQFNPSMVRGLDYYTGTIIECSVDGYPSSVAGGGRYDSLVQGLIGQKVPAVGVSFGVDRLVDIIDQQGQENQSIIFIARLPETTELLNPWVRELRSAGKNVEVYLDQTVELGKQIKYADKRGYKEMFIPLEEDWKQGKIVCKNLESGTQESVERASIINA